ncbi:histidine kinase [Rhodococcus sp. AD45-ID]|uniref:sensor histidine kinase n=2 Tax=Nocardiaceae TaxID=85025 RepID=UPI0005DB3D46|nr:histidine kinase [Rhodococcus globerulus]KJF21102.1 Sensor histidine kinase desK [Rhodococcus sp. AD45]NRI65164.1 histidine kinase [Rhodococcus sp. MS16]PSR38631.1 histidine kinase [Rhodococcus sp. AD45-ID]RZL27426.1 MAG: histidine kinase [Rhodococcus sp. (in: high G+C Gram-positive bacteria)]QXW02511.1 histidine kinase [Rhodococcus globerulus]
MSETTRPIDSAAMPRRNRFGILFAAVWMIFLGGPLIEGWNLRDELRGWAGILATLTFGALYLYTFARVQQRRLTLSGEPTVRRAVLTLAGLTALAAVIIVSVGPTGLATAPYLAVTAVTMLPTVAGGILTLAIAASVEIVSVSAGWGNYSGLSLGVCAAAFATWGVMSLIRRNIAMVHEREEQELRAVMEERARMARDLHDILGHSLTVITVKAELANRLLDVDVERARSELDDLERLSRDALADVRSAVDGFRTISLPVEIARAREALRAAGIEDHSPNSTEMVPRHLRELFAWTVREGVTNVVRHSAATQCTITIDEKSVEIVDDGISGENTTIGNGLTGLRERAAAAGARLTINSAAHQGFSLQVHEQENT